MDKVYDAAVIGLGPAGIACIVQLKRYGLNVIGFEKNEIGGLLRNANSVENYPGVPQGIKGKELAKEFINQIEEHKIFPVYKEIVQAKFIDNYFEIKTKDSGYFSKFLALATGTVTKKLNIAVPENLKHKFFYEICDFYKEKKDNSVVVIIGSGDAAFDYALNIAENTDIELIFILNKNEKTKCIEILKQRTSKIKKIQLLNNSFPTTFEAVGNQINVICNDDLEIICNSVIVAIGRESDLSLISQDLKSSERFFVIGDAKNPDFRQTSISCGDGTRAAMEIFRQISNKN